MSYFTRRTLFATVTVFGGKVKCILRPIMEVTKRSRPDMASLEIVDVGAGSGSLTASLCRQAKGLGESSGFNPIISLRFVDLELADPSRFFRAKKSRTRVDSLTFIGDDYRSWLSRPQFLSNINTLRIAILSKLLNNLSSFTILDVSREDFPRDWGGTPVSSDSEVYLPTVCLAPDGEGGKALAVSNARIDLLEGRTFLQPSLSQFYKGLYVMKSSDQLQIQPAGDLYLICS